MLQRESDRLLAKERIFQNLLLIWGINGIYSLANFIHNQYIDNLECKIFYRAVFVLPIGKNSHCAFLVQP